MASDIFQQLAQRKVPPPPDSLGDEVHRRVNASLLVLHLIDFIVRMLPGAMWQFARAVWGLVDYSLSGRFAEPPDRTEGDE